MADAARFPNLALPFAIVGASAGWLSSGLIANPLLGFGVDRLAVTVTATALAALTGLLLKRLCVGRRYGYEMGDPDPEVRPGTDAWWLHVGVVLAAGAATGLLVAAVCARCGAYGDCAASGATCAAAFAPVCLAVIAAARRAQRARLGSLVAGADRRAVWGILAILLAVMTLEALPDWPAWSAGEGPPPVAVAAALLLAGAVTGWTLRADRRAIADAHAVKAAELTSRDPDQARAEGIAPRLDLGLGDDMLARLARGAAAYRQRERTVSLIRGNPQRAIDALRRGVRRSALGLAVIGAACAAHAATATSRTALATYQVLRCSSWNPEACELAAQLVQDSDRPYARALRRRAYTMSKHP